MIIKKPLYLYASLYNYFAATLGICVFFFDLGFRLFYYEGYDKSNWLSWSYNLSLSGTIALFGFCYYLVYRNPNKFMPLLIPGLFGKVGVFIGIPFLYFMGKAHVLAFILAIGDFVWSVFFLKDMLAAKIFKIDAD